MAEIETPTKSPEVAPPTPSGAADAFEANDGTPTIVVIGGGASFLNHMKELTSAPNTSAKIIAVMGTPFLEWTLASTAVIANPDLHGKFLSPNPESFKVPGVEYVFGKVVEINTETKTITLESGSPVQGWTALVVATGNRMPLVLPEPGCSLEQRMAEVKAAGDAIKAVAERKGTIVVNGPGAVGLELAGDIKSKHQGARVVVLSRSGNVLTTHSPEWQAKVKDRLDVMNIEVVKGKIDNSLNMPIVDTPGTLALTGGDVAELDYDIFLPAYSQGPSTNFLKGSEGILNEKGQIVVNQFLQSTTDESLFSIGTSTQELAHPNSMCLKEQAITVAKNVKAKLSGKSTDDFVSYAHPAMTGPLPMNIKIGHGTGAYMFWDESTLPCPVKTCCCLYCRGGFPFCPLPCCWCCCPGCAKCYGNCGSPAEGEGPAIFAIETMNVIFPKGNHFVGIGEAPKEAAIDRA